MTHDATVTSSGWYLQRCRSHLRRKLGDATVLGNADMSLMRMHFIKPQAALVMAFSDDPQMGMLSDRFTGSATTKLATRSLRTAWVR